MIRRFVLLALVCLPLASSAPVQAIEVEGFTLSDSNRKVQRDYDPIVGNDPEGEVLVPTLSQCRTNPGNVVVPIEMQFSNNLHVAEFSVSWEDPESNNLHIYFFDELGALLAESAGASMPEEVGLGSLDNGQYYLCVRNFSGVNTGFKLVAEVRQFDYYTRGPDRFPTPDPTPSAAPEATARPTPRSTATPQPATADEVATPGPDGPFSDRNLVNVAGSKQAAADEGGRSVAQWVFIGLTGLIAAGGAGLVVLRIRRDTTV